MRSLFKSKSRSPPGDVTYQNNEAKQVQKCPENMQKCISGRNRTFQVPELNAKTNLTPDKVKLNGQTSFQNENIGNKENSNDHLSENRLKIEHDTAGHHIQCQPSVTYNRYTKRGGNSLKSFSRLQSTLKYILREEKIDRNDITVLALGVNQYLEEVFSTLDSTSSGFIDHLDLELLCKLVGKSYSPPDNIICLDSSRDEVCRHSECQVHIHCAKFIQIMSRLFATNLQALANNFSNEKLVETVVNVSRRNASLQHISSALEKVESQYIDITASDESGIDCCDEDGNSKICLDANENIACKQNKFHQKNLELQKILLLQLQELQCLRELVEDLRIALQTADAENLGLKVNEEKLKIQQQHCFCRQVRSFPDEQDSIDRLIINFPSNEDLDLPSSYYQTHEEDSGTGLEPFSEQINLNQKLSSAHEELSEAKLQLSEAKTLLNEAAVNQSVEIQKMTRDFVAMEENLRLQVLELSEEVTSWRNKFENQRTNEEILRNELKHKINDLNQSKTDLQMANKCRQRDLDLLRRTRNLLAKTLVETSNSEEILKPQAKVIPTRHYAVDESQDSTLSKLEFHKRRTSFSNTRHDQSHDLNHFHEEFAVQENVIKTKKRSASDEKEFESKVAKLNDNSNSIDRLQCPKSDKIDQSMITQSLSFQDNGPIFRCQSHLFEDKIQCYETQRSPVIDHSYRLNNQTPKSYSNPVPSGPPSDSLEITINNKQTSTQILESLEAQVEMLRKSLDEDSYGII